MIYIGVVLAIVLGCALFSLLFICFWNESNLEMRRAHRLIAEEYIIMGKRDLALTHYEKAKSLQKWFIKL